MSATTDEKRSIRAHCCRQRSSLATQAFIDRSVPHREVEVRLDWRPCQATVASVLEFNTGNEAKRRRGLPEHRPEVRLQIGRDSKGQCTGRALGPEAKRSLPDLVRGTLELPTMRRDSADSPMAACPFPCSTCHFGANPVTKNLAASAVVPTVPPDTKI